MTRPANRYGARRLSRADKQTAALKRLHMADEIPTVEWLAAHGFTRAEADELVAKEEARRAGWGLG